MASTTPLPSIAATDRRLADLAFHTIERRLGVASQRHAVDPALHHAPHHGVFVTILVGGHLRGCIGYLDPEMPLDEAVRMAADGAAAHDHRFPAVTADELDDLTLEISLLGPFERIHHAKQIEIGIHGIVLEHGYARGLLLPQVAPEQGWDALEFLRALCRKAGVPAHTWKDQDARIHRFTADVAHHRFADWRDTQ